MHKKFPALSSHNLLDVSQGNQAGNHQPRLPEFPTERCGTHQGKVLEMYCGKHDVVGCHICFSKDHRSCPDSQIFSISDMIDKLFNLMKSKETHNRLRDMVGSITTHCDSNDVRLASLLEAKNAALQKVAKFQKALEAAVKKALEMSKKEIEDLYKKLEEEILQDNADVKNTRDVLQSTSDKLKKAEANRAQRFVCTKLAEALMENADDQISKRKFKNLTDVQLSFTPNQSLMEYINGLHGIGEVVRSTEKRTDLYKIKGRNYLSTFKDIDLMYTDGVCVDGRGNIFVVGCHSHNVVQFDENGKKIGVVIKQQDGLKYEIYYILKKFVMHPMGVPDQIQDFFYNVRYKERMTAKLLTSISVLGLSFWLNMVAVCVPYWWCQECDTGNMTYVGLYKYCQPEDVDLNCTSTISTDNTRWLVSVQILSIFYVLCIFLSIGLISYYIIWYQDEKVKIKIALGTIVLGGSQHLSRCILTIKTTCV
ncbi:hypothetical protein ACF0H5_017798 [Mactra antiquata]